MYLHSDFSFNANQIKYTFTRTLVILLIGITDDKKDTGILLKRPQPNDGAKRKRELKYLIKRIFVEESNEFIRGYIIMNKVNIFHKKKKSEHINKKRLKVYLEILILILYLFV